ncbi:MAG: arylsulfatase [Candidatus Brocadiia bacterium]
MPEQRPNVLMILTDDQGYGDLSCHGHPVLHTPNIDRLHDESVRLTDFHVAPMCAPTRGELMSGVHCLRNGAMATSLGRHLLKPELPTIADMFHADGYATGIFGKWHLGDSYPYRPHDRGFEEAIYHHGFGLTGADAYWENDYLNPYYRHNGELKQAEGYCTDFWFDTAMDWMAEQNEQGRPFLCYLPTNVPHFPMWVDDCYKEEFAAYGGRPSGFFGMIVELDENLARMEKFLRENGLREDTIVIFMTDNGHAGGALDVYNAGMRGGKCSRYDGGHRVPCFIRWPGGDLQPPGDVPVPTQAMDILPMLLDLCGVEAADGAAFDGNSLAPMLRGEPHDLDERMTVVQYYQNSIGKDDCSVIWRQWRLVFGEELYDIREDRGQQHDLADEHPDIVSAMRDFYERWWEDVEPGIHVFSPLTIGSRHQDPVMLTSCEWEDVRCDGAGSVRSANKGGDGRGGPWNIEVSRAGEYEVELRRWPEESGLSLTDPAPAFHAAYGTLDAGVALPIASGVLAHDGEPTEKDAQPGAESVTYRLRLPAGRTKLHGWFRDEAGEDVCGAYYAYFRRL